MLHCPFHHMFPWFSNDHLLNTHVNLSHVADFSPVSTDHVLLAVLTVYKGGNTTLCSATACVFIYLSLFSYEVGRKSLDDSSVVHLRSKVRNHWPRLDISRDTFEQHYGQIVNDENMFGWGLHCRMTSYVLCIPTPNHIQTQTWGLLIHRLLILPSTELQNTITHRQVLNPDRQQIIREVFDGSWRTKCSLTD